MKGILIGLGIGLLSFLVTTLLIVGIKKQEKVDCLKLQAQSVEFQEAGFYLTAWQKEMCDAQNIIINAPVYVPTEYYE